MSVEPKIQGTLPASTSNTANTIVQRDSSGYIAVAGVSIATGSNAKAGTAVLSSGAATVSTTAVTASSIIIISNNSVGGTIGILAVTAKTAGVSFVITSANVLDTSTIAWVIIN